MGLKGAGIFNSLDFVGILMNITEADEEQGENHQIVVTLHRPGQVRSSVVGVKLQLNQ